MAGRSKNERTPMKRPTIGWIKRRALPVLRRHGVTRAGIFGSTARGERKRGSDIDVLVEIKEDISLLDFVGIKLELEQALGMPVDLVEYSTIKPLVRDRILEEQVVII
jgi:predicted nucleotidyltransferase